MKPEPTKADAAPPGPVFARVYEEHFDYVYNSLRRLGARTADLEDLSQEVFVVAYRRLDSYDPQRPIRPWLFGISFRVLADRRKSARADRETDPVDEQLTDPAPSPDQRVEAREARDLVLEALSALELERRAVFVMHEIHGESAPDISRALDVPLNTVYTRLRLARRDFTAAVRRIQARRATG